MAEANENRRKTDEKSNRNREEDLIKNTSEAYRKNDDQIKAFQRSQNQALEDSQKNRQTLNQQTLNQTQEAIRKMSERASENDQQLRKANQQITDSYQTQLDALKKTTENAENYYSTKNQKVMEEKERHYNDLLRERTIEGDQKLKYLGEQLDKQAAQARQMSEIESQRRDALLEDTMTHSEEQKKIALEKQAKGYERAMSQQNAKDSAKIKYLEDALHTTKTSTDPNLISPAAEERIRKILTQSHKKELDTEVDKHNRYTTQLIENKQTELNNAREDYQSELLRAKSEFEREITLNRSNFLDTVAENEVDAATRLKDSESSTAYQIEALHRHYGRLLEKQKRDFNNAFDSSRSAAEIRFNEFKQEAEMAAKLAHKTAVAEKTDLIKSYERKLQKLKEDHENNLDIVKTQAIVDVHATEQRLKQEIEAQGKSHEQKLAQALAQHKERERIAEQNYQDEIDRTKRSYELLIQKKS
ncbi:MAG: hypothetical protein ACO3A2_07310 [Bdellovibrionia bacterium]